MIADVGSRNVLIVGKGAAGTTLADSLREHGDTVVGFLDDAVVGDDVFGRLVDVNEVIKQHDVHVLYFAIPSVDAATVREFLSRIDVDGVEVAIIPRTYGVLAKESVHIDDLTDVDVLDLVGRRPVKQDLLAARDFISGKTVLVTGAAGSIGSRILRQVLALEAKLVIGVDWNEGSVFFLGKELEGENLELRVGDVTNEQFVRGLIRTYTPDVVFHAAAFKHVPLMQANPREAIINNIGGTVAVMRAAAAEGVSNLVYVSTDKAVNPVNVMGATKRLGEMAMEAIAATSTTRFNAVRFGNVIQSSGSVMQIFREQIANKRPVTVTHPDVTRFFMTIDEASQLVIQSAFVGSPGDLFVLDMGESVRILDLAKSLVGAVAPGLEIQITGLRPGEKLYEELSYEPDRVAPTANPKIFLVRDEVAFDQDAFMSQVEDLLERARRYELGPDEAVEALRAFGFDIQ